VHIYIYIYTFTSLWIFTSLQFLVYTTLYFFLNLNSFAHLLLRRRSNTSTIFTLLQVSLFFFICHSFTHAIAFLFVACPHMRDIRRVLIMLLDRWPLSSPFHEIPARGGTTYYVPGPSVPSHTVFHGDRPHWDRLNVVALKRGDSGVNFSARIKGALKLCGLNFVVHSAVVRANCVLIGDKSNSDNVVHIDATILYFNDLSCQIKIIEIKWYSELQKEKTMQIKILNFKQFEALNERTIRLQINSKYFVTWNIILDI